MCPFPALLQLFTRVAPVLTKCGMNTQTRRRGKWTRCAGTSTMCPVSCSTLDRCAFNSASPSPICIFTACRICLKMLKRLTLPAAPDFCHGLSRACRTSSCRTRRTRASGCGTCPSAPACRRSAASTTASGSWPPIRRSTCWRQATTGVHRFLPNSFATSQCVQTSQRSDLQAANHSEVAALLWFMRAECELKGAPCLHSL